MYKNKTINETAVLFLALLFISLSLVEQTFSTYFKMHVCILSFFSHTYQKTYIMLLGKCQFFLLVVGAKL